MATTKLKVIVMGGTTPFSIKTQLFKGGQFVMGLTNPGSFEHLFTGLSGTYSLLVSGANPLGANGRTRVEVTTNEIILTSDSDTSPTTRTGKAYLVQFHFTA